MIGIVLLHVMLQWCIIPHHRSTMYSDVAILPLVCSIDAIIDHYKREQIVEGYYLREPVSVQVSPRSLIL